MHRADIRRLTYIREATGKLAKDTKQRRPELRWRAVYGFRNIAAHGYLDLQLDRIWEIVEDHLADLRTVVDQELRLLEN
jgi:uncharacterized protein with HEPN domain